MKMVIDMSSVKGCEVTECAYNLNRDCQARAITIGDGDHPRCDTFLPSSSHTRPNGGDAGVGACKVSICTHNVDLECGAELIQIGRHSGHADCMTFAPRA